MDFRARAADASGKLLDGKEPAALADLGQSVCLPVAGGRRVQYVIEIPYFVFALVMLLAALGALLLLVFDYLALLQEVRFVELLSAYLPRIVRLAALVGALVLLLVADRAQAFLLNVYLRRRRGSLLRAFRGLRKVYVRLEEAATVQKTKFIPEDQGTCLLDYERQRILIEGCQYRYVIYGRDVSSVTPVSSSSMSGAAMSCRIAGEGLELVLAAAGLGPVARLIQTRDPSRAASGLADKLNGALFGEGPDIPQQEGRWRGMKLGKRDAVTLVLLLAEAALLCLALVSEHNSPMSVGGMGGFFLLAFIGSLLGLFWTILGIASKDWGALRCGIVLLVLNTIPTVAMLVYYLMAIL